MHRTLCSIVFLAAAASVSRAQVAGDFATGSDYIAWPEDTPEGLTKVEGGNITPDGLADVIALYGSSLYLVHAPAEFPRWNWFADEVADFAIAKKALTSTAEATVYSDASGLSTMRWSSDQAVVTGIAGTSAWASSTQLCAISLVDGSTVVAGVQASDAKNILRGTLAANGQWTSMALIKESSAVTSLALADYSSDTGVEVASVAGGALHIRSATGSLLGVSGIQHPNAHRVVRLEGAGDGRDSFAYVAASNQPSPATEVVYEVFPGGASLPIEIAPWTVRDLHATRPWVSPKRAVTMTSANYADAFRVEDVGWTPQTSTFALPSSVPDEQLYWHIPLTDPSAAPVSDARAAFGDFDADGLDDVIVFSDAHRTSYFYPAVDDEFRFGTLTIDGSSAYSSATNSLVLAATLTVSGTPRGFTSAPNGVECVVWVRNGLANMVDAACVATVIDPVQSGGDQMTISVPTPYDPGATLVYLEFCSVIADFSGSHPVVLQRSTPVNCVTMLDPQDPVLCTLFTTEPDRYSDDNLARNGCTDYLDPDGPVIVNGFNRRSSIGPMSGGSGSPGGGG